MPSRLRSRLTPYRGPIAGQMKESALRLRRKRPHHGALARAHIYCSSSRQEQKNELSKKKIVAFEFSNQSCNVDIHGAGGMHSTLAKRRVYTPVAGARLQQLGASMGFEKFTS